MEILTLPFSLYKTPVNIFVSDLNESKYSAPPNLIRDERSKNSNKGDH